MNIQRVRKVGVVGAHGCGKTTLVGRIRDDAVEAGLVPVVVQETIRTRLDIPRNFDMTVGGQAEFFQMQIAEEAKAAGLVAPGLGDFVVCDRTVLDVLVYATFARDHGIGGDSMRDEWAAFIDARVPVMVREFGGYDVVWWCRPAENMIQRCTMLEDDGVRDVRLDFQAEVDFLFERYIKDYGLMVEDAGDYCFDRIMVLDGVA